MHRGFVDGRGHGSPRPRCGCSSASCSRAQARHAGRAARLWPAVVVLPGWLAQRAHRGCVAPGADELVIDTRWYDGFAGSALDGALRARGVTSLVVTGTMTDIGVLATVIGAFNREYRVTVVGDGVATLGPEIQRAALDIVARAYGRVV